MTQHSFRPRRSCLYVPGINDRAMAKIPSLGADVFIMDLEDAVDPSAKDTARHAVVNWLADRPSVNAELLVRINGVDSPWGHEDLAAIVAAQPDGIVVPKVSAKADMLSLNEQLDSLGASTDLSLWAMIETPLGVLNASSIAAASQSTRLAGLIVGCNDLAKAMGLPGDPPRDAFIYALQSVIMAGKSYDLAVIDAVYNAINEESGLRSEAQQARSWGFQGKTIIHPKHIDIVNSAFTPTAEELAADRQLVALFERPGNEEVGVVAMEGRMVERLHYLEAKQRLALYDRIRDRRDAE